MCGIVGSVNKPFGDEILNLIDHRGPNDRGIEKIIIEQANSKKTKIYFGHTRLSIQDLSLAGHQPMYSHCGNYLIIFNGEIYNHLELRKKLPNINWRGHSDTETIINYIAEYGIESVQDLNGIFAFAVLDILQRKLYLVRDRYGVKPLYYNNNDNNNKFVFSSEIKPLRKLIPSKIDLENLATLLKLRYNPAPTTLYNNIRKLRPGHIIEYDIQTCNFKIYPFISPVYENKNITFKKALQNYEELFEQAVKRQLLADVEIGVLLSGGIDSALIAYYAQKYSDKPIKTFTIGFNENDDSDEILDARKTAQILGTEHNEVRINDEQFENIFQQCIDIVEEPLGTTSIIPMYYLNKLVADHGIKVVLTGQGADEPLGGYSRYLGEMMYGKIPPFLIRLFKPFSKFVKNESIYRAINSLGEKDTIKRWEFIYSLFSDKEINNLISIEDKKSYELIKYFYELLDGKNKDNVNAMMSNDIRMNLCDDLLLYTDKISMHFSIEARVPMLDNDLVDFIESLPLKYKIKGKERKYIHKKFAEKVLPKEIIYRKKKGFKSPTEKWFKEERGLKYKNLLKNKNGLFSKYFNTEEVAKIFDLHMRGTRNMEKQLFTLISIFYWMEKKCRVST
ncbi:asparagine synthase (glutamine-hydrolysing) [Nitratiruptor sp. YY08-26]|uniref:asparagine synthase (glutamine-hydrolyzing) n=1 Tax=unclassified Nitratiruptor TaxID=2624044 RepID=UPI0019163E40|nr:MULTISPECIES: asparagine synthase (glutamine-hydrolyzing) [unclassified Nitratiruptor]BCD62078.1 asparagine synthase (glutamine-hydrolysing) [Nitratiruptor sp. YY08-13]BCD66014.1 asparagine synthase (glutamine-hydrolysing) [Nitratiruptor sp. YY08-26]